ncbi:MAG: hypothetical protein WA941_08975 [Nitrososphaeraceae archaeon]
MNEIRIPGWLAEASVYNSSEVYYLTAKYYGEKTSGVQPALMPVPACAACCESCGDCCCGSKGCGCGGNCGPQSV